MREAAPQTAIITTAAVAGPIQVRMRPGAGALFPFGTGCLAFLPLG